MNTGWLTSHLANLVLAILGFLASPTGGRETGRSFLQKIGLRGSGHKRK